MFIDLDKKDPLSLAVLDDAGTALTYGELTAFSKELQAVVGGRKLVFILSENCSGALAGYTGMLAARIVPLMLPANIDSQLYGALLAQYSPSFIYAPCHMAFSGARAFEKYGYALIPTGMKCHSLNDELSLLLPTSGSTGSPKLVRHSYKNVEANARAVAEAFSLTPSERAMEALPLHFTQGLNVATSCLYAGGTVLLSRATLMQKQFWDFFKAQRATSFTGVPYSYELLNKLRFFRMDLPYLRTINQGGGRMTDEMFTRCASYAKDTGKRFIATYGSTETCSRMAYLPPELALTKTGSIGRPLPGCNMTLQDEDGAPAEKEGEIVFCGPNVTMGYAESGEDLIKGDERDGVYHTGDMAYRDEDGCYFIVGRKKRFLKLFGYRVSLDETERLIRSRFNIECACAGSDKGMLIYVTEQGKENEITEFLTKTTGIYTSAFAVRFIEALPKNEAGKTLYSKLGE